MPLRFGLNLKYSHAFEDLGRDVFVWGLFAGLRAQSCEEEVVAVSVSIVFKVRLRTACCCIG